MKHRISVFNKSSVTFVFIQKLQDAEMFAFILQKNRNTIFILHQKFVSEQQLQQLYHSSKSTMICGSFC